MTSNTLFVFHWTLWSIYRLFIIQLLEVSESTSVSSKTLQVSSMKTHMKDLSFLSFDIVFGLQVQELDFCLKLHQLKKSDLWKLKQAHSSTPSGPVAP